MFGPNGNKGASDETSPANAGTGSTDIPGNDESHLTRTDLFDPGQLELTLEQSQPQS